MNKIFVVSAFYCLSLFFSVSVDAREGRLVSDFEHFYEDFRMRKLSQMYWRLGILDINNANHVDNFLYINECDIYKEYHNNEFEWQTIRRQAQLSIKNDIEYFPNRFKYTQPLLLSQYDFEEKRFGIQKKFQIEGRRKFEILSQDFWSPICTQRSPKDIDSYPRAVVVEINQPFHLKSIAMDSKVAKRYIDKKLKPFYELPERRRTRDEMLKYRDAYLVMKMRIYSHRGNTRVTGGAEANIFNAIMEGYEIYSDQHLTNLLYFKNYLRDKGVDSVGERLRKEYEALKSSGL